MKNELKIGSALSILTIVVGSLIQIFYTPLYMKYLGTIDFGINSLVQSIMGYIGMLNLGLGNAMLRYTVRYRAEGKFEEEKSLNGMFLTIFSILMIISIFLGAYIYVNIPNFFSDKFTAEELSKTKSVFLLMMLNVAISFPVGVFSTNIASREKFLYQRGLSLVKTIVTPIVGAVLMLNGFGLIAVTISIVVSGLIVSMFDVIYARKLGMKISFRNFDFKVLKEIFHYSFYIFLNIIIDRVYWGTDRVIIGKYIGVTAVGIYSIASIFNTLYMNFSTAISGVLFPKINRLIVEDKHEEISNLFIRVGRLQYILLGLISSGFILFGKEFIYLWLGEGYSEVYKIALWIMIPLTVPLIQNTGIAIMQAKNMHQFRSVIYCIIAIGNVISSILLVKQYGAIGCAIATGISFMIGNIVIMNIYYYKRLNLDIPLFWKNILKMSIPIAITMGVGILLNKHIININYINFLIKVIIYGGTYFILLFFLGLNKDEKKEILKMIVKHNTEKNTIKD
ncbi:polysaccharide biosynthesis protein [Cetobacterium somerae ATCC BAA-474]|uniref:Polysaccharide biosynthesis protein n=1 Tax=Cetobacterium somerae ATCC BAA-474 TaxID=1319815 RepID=U7V6W2_9FUSO|nr:oligosaccharide flippase family protein [Cetobacterium somerae]ERT66523.1 polysaccharide biosynthesis protein [Cetobacterium somerae ATCC BAA-474]